MSESIESPQPPEPEVDKMSQTFDAIGKLLAENGIDSALVLATDEEGAQRMFVRGHMYEAAKLLAAASSDMRQQVMGDLGPIL